LREPARQLDARFAEAESIRFTGLSIAPRRAIPRDARSQKKVSGGKILTRLMPNETSASRRKAQSEIVERSWWDERMGLVFKICGVDEWRRAEREKVFRGSAVDLRDGFIHFSTAEQLAETAAKHFAGRVDLLLIAVDAEALGENLRFEPSRGGALFPHLYAELSLSAVRFTEPMPLGDNGIPLLPSPERLRSHDAARLSPR
jgi:uncharacterized protein (DUF952 family)